MDEDKEKNADRRNDAESSEMESLQKQLYQRDEPEEFKERREAIRNPIHVEKEEYDEGDDPELIDAMSERMRKRKQAFIVGGVVLGCIMLFSAAAAATWWYRLSRQVVEDHVHVTVDAPDQFTAGDEISYVVSYKNDSNVSWVDAELEFEPPGGFRFADATHEYRMERNTFVFSLGTLQSEEEGVITVRGQLLGEQDAALLARAQLTISPENFPQNRITNGYVATTIIASVPLEVSIEAPQEASDGQRIFATVRVRNMGNNTLEESFLKISPAEGMRLAVQDPGFTEGFDPLDSTWRLPPLGPLEEVERRVVMIIEGREGDRRQLEAEAVIRDGGEMFTLRSLRHTLSISTPRLRIVQSFNDQDDGILPVVTGDRITGTVRYHNTGNTGITDAVISTTFEGFGMDEGSLRLRSGSYDPSSRTITWTSASVPELAHISPGEQGELTYDFVILPTDRFPTEGAEVKNHQVAVVASIDSPDLPTPTGQDTRVVTNRFSLPIMTNFVINPTAFYDDGRLGLTSSGPEQPHVGQETTYTVRFRLASTLNDLGDVTMRAVLAEGVQYTGQMYRTEGSFDYNERTNELVWTVPMIEGLSGRTSPGPELHVQVMIRPGEHLRGSDMDLVRSVSGEGMDMFVDGVVEARLQGDLPTTSMASSEDGRVQ